VIINQASLTGMHKSFNTLFNELFQSIDPQYKKIAMDAPSTGRETTYAWLGDFPGMREWVGERQVQNLMAHDYTIKNRSFEATVSVDRDDIADDQIGMYSPRVRELARAAAVHPDKLVAALLVSGFNSLCYDGQYFFDTDHPVGASTVSNSGGGTGTGWYLLDTSRAVRPLIWQMRQTAQFTALDSPTDSNTFMKKQFLYGVDYRGNAGYGPWQLAYGSKDTLNAANYAAARAAMIAFRDAKGEPLGVIPNLLVVHSGNEAAAREILLNERAANGATNTWRGTAELLVMPWLG